MPLIDKPYLRSLFLQEKHILKSIYDSSDEIQLAKLIKNLEESHINVILRICHLIASHEISLSKEGGKIIIAKKKMKLFLSNFKSTKSFNYLIETSRNQK